MPVGRRASGFVLVAMCLLMIDEVCSGFNERR
jgi:hypothetical protein